jgi:hypothetical protein
MPFPILVVPIAPPRNKERAQRTAERQQAYFKDAMKFCDREITDVQRITACMVKNIHKLSPTAPAT